MRYRWHPKARHLRRASALIGVVCIALGLVIFPDVTGQLPSARAGSVTVPGPHMYDPKTGQDSANPSSVTVDQTSDLTAQMVHVSWSGFTPSTRLDGSPETYYDARTTLYPVMVAQCRGLNPTSQNDCFGADHAGVPASLTPDGPMNTAYGNTLQDGTGRLDMRLLTTLDNTKNGCDKTTDCSLVIFPAQGGMPPQGTGVDNQWTCTDHSADRDGPTARADFAFFWLTGSDSGSSNSDSSTGFCTWAKRIVIPLHFAPSPTNCPLHNSNFSAAGSPIAGRAINQWRAGICNGANHLSVAYDSATNEPAASAAFLAGGQGAPDMTLTTRPAAATGQHPFGYGPVTVTGVAIAYWIDDPRTGQPLPELKLNQRLLAKLLTLSYSALVTPCPSPGQQQFPCDKAVEGNPFELFSDKEFQQLNPTIASIQQQIGSDAQIYPTVPSGNSDLTYEVTRWIASSADARTFMSGTKDPYGMRVNDNYKGTTYPTDTFLNMDSFVNFANGYQPVYPLDQVAAYLAGNWRPGTGATLDNTGNYPKFDAQIPGRRDLIAIVPLADAAAYRFPVAKILNAGGQYVAPTSASLAAAVKHMSTNPDGITQQVDMTNTDPAAYPLTMVQYAMAPTSGIDKAKAGKIAAFLDFAAGSGQTLGIAPGTLPAGMLPLNAAQKRQTSKLASDVRCQCPSSPHPTNTSSSSSSSSSTSTASSSSSSTATATPTASSSTSPAALANATLKPSPSAGVHLPSVAPALSSGQRPADAAGFTRYLLPVLLIAAGVLAVGGPAVFAFGRTTWGAMMIYKIRQNGFVGRFAP